MVFLFFSLKTSAREFLSQFIRKRTEYFQKKKSKTNGRRGEQTKRRPEKKEAETKEEGDGSSLALVVMLRAHITEQPYKWVHNATN
jgi:hypothetical protein